METTRFFYAVEVSPEDLEWAKQRSWNKLVDRKILNIRIALCCDLEEKFKLAHGPDGQDWGESYLPWKWISSFMAEDK